MSMMSGLPGGFQLPRPGQGADFGLGLYHQQALAQRMQACGGFNRLMYAPPQHLPPAAGFHGGCFAGSPIPLTAGASSGGASSEAVASPRVRVREGPTAQEVKEEPQDPLRPRPGEVGMVEMLRKHGVSTPDAVYSLRKSENRFDEALQFAMDIANTREESRQLDRARLESEKEKDRAAELQRVKDKTLMVLGEVISHFPQSLLLDKEDGCATFRQFVERLSAGDGTCSQALCVFRERAITLLFLERDASRHYPENDRQIRGYFRELSRRLENHVRAGRETHAGDDGETENATEEIGAEAAETLGATARATKSGGCEGNETDENRTKQFTDSVQEEVGKLQRIMYDFPKTPGGVPEAFLDDRTRENAATLEKDGVEEDHDRNRSNRTKDSVVITIDG
ncbi:unnamed protein product [Pylaiella littoralis]